MRKSLLATIAGAALIAGGGLAAAQQRMEDSLGGASGAQGSSQRELGGAAHERQPGGEVAQGQDPEAVRRHRGKRASLWPVRRDARPDPEAVRRHRGKRASLRPVRPRNGEARPGAVRRRRGKGTSHWPFRRNARRGAGAVWTISRVHHIVLGSENPTPRNYRRRGCSSR